MRRLFLLLAILVAVPDRVDAAPCANLPNPVYLQVGDTQLNVMKRLGRALRDNTPNPISLVFITSGSCANITAIYTRVPITMNMQYIPSMAEDPAWVPSSPTLSCEAPTGGVVPDIANSAVFNSICTQDPPPATVRLTEGPKQAYVMAVPESQTEHKAITFEEAYFTFGFGAAGMINPWMNESQMFIRTITKSTLLAWAANISVPGDKWKGMRFDGSPMVVAAVEAGPPEAIGILGQEVYDSRRATLNILAFRSRGQYAAYYPDSDATSFDKKNVRDGHYTVWSPTIWMDTVDGAGAPVSARARYVVDLIAGRSVIPAQNFDMTKIVADVGLVPDCAMGVKREYEGGPLSLYQPAESCVCKFESLVASSSCATCDGTTPCATGTCRAGFCEVR
ncbi:MAG TPA: hypothetical protein VIU61_21375 [Kofleriaceae bacterium]